MHAWKDLLQHDNKSACILRAALINFVNPELLGCVGAFKRMFGDPIMRARDRGATPEEAELGRERSAELNRRVEAFVLRRIKDVNAAFLPPLASYVVMCLPTPLQVKSFPIL
jgi:SNF2 family DNA or RNA helicase